MLTLSPTIIGSIFVPNITPNEEWTCIGYASNDTFLIVGSFFDVPNNRSFLRTFKFGDIKFKGELK